jgi:hypothetical protein
MVIRGGDAKNFKRGRLMFSESRFLHIIFLDGTKKIQDSKVTVQDWFLPPESKHKILLTIIRFQRNEQRIEFL